MNETLPAKVGGEQARRLTRDDLPKRGEFFWVKFSDWNKKVLRELMCVESVGSNHIKFANDDYTVRVRHRDLAEDTEQELRWREVLQEKIDAKQAELQVAIRALADSMNKADLLPSEVETTPTLLPSTSRRSPTETKKSLIKLKEETLPAATKQVEQITQEMVKLHKMFYQPQLIEANVLKAAAQGINDRLFVLELYAGMWENIKTLREGKPADKETPITVRQMLRYMDEETLFDLDSGGMDYEKLADFDKWVAKEENFKRLCPEPKCIVAFKVRRHAKEYPAPSTMFGWFLRMEEHIANMKTYLLMRNGEQIFRLATEIEFDPRLLPLSDEFNRAFVKVHRHYDWEKRKENVVEEKIGPDHLDYDEQREEAKKLMFKYNRILFLVQGLLDRSKVFYPHPPINLADPDAVEQWFKPIFDEEHGLPQSHPPKWEEYRDRMNAKLKTGDHAFAKWDGEEYQSWRAAGDRTFYYRQTGIFEVTKIKKDRSEVRVSWPYEDREGWEHPTGWGNGYGKYGKWKVNKTHHKWVPMKDVFNVEAYQLNDYKPFYCDAQLKGEYLEWAPQLLGAELWRRTGNEQRTQSTR
jgi:hypothetical protein